ncbi:MAG TPA: hypothetical protein VFX49_17530 [Chloroflexota bacterium]|nr:hypothetical protein [Chloroflexota bacterium]
MEDLGGSVALVIEAVVAGIAVGLLAAHLLTVAARRLDSSPHGRATWSDADGGASRD